MWRPHPCIAHRGGARLAPENTLPAYAAAARWGHTCAECDVQLTADGVPVLLHDDRVDRTSDGRGELAALAAADLAGLDAGSWFHPRFAGTRIPTLEEAMACWAGLQLAPVVELKCGRDRDPERLGATVAAALAARWRGPAPLLISFDDRALAAAARAAPDLPRGLLLEDWPADWRERVRALAACCLDLESGLAAADRVAAAHAAGLAVAAWTVDDPAEAARLRAIGVDAITTDAIDLIRP